MNGNELLDKLSLVSPEYIEAAENAKKHLPVRWLRWTAAAACVCLVAAVSVVLIRSGLTNPGSSAGSGGGEGITYMSYAGPVFPLSALTEAPALTAERRIDFDFSQYETRTESYSDADGVLRTYEAYDSDALVTDSYTLTNSQISPQTVTLLYPFAGSLRSRTDELPAVTVDGAAVSPALNIGPYTGTFKGVTGRDDDALLNLSGLYDWESYKALVEADYLSRALDAFPVLTQPVTVYEFTNITGGENPSAAAPTLNMAFSIDYSRTSIFTYGFNGGRNDPKSGACERHFVIPRSTAPDYGETRYLIVLGDDLAGYTLKGYTDGSLKTPLEDAGADVIRYESTLGEILLKTAGQYLDDTAAVIFDGTEEMLLSSLSRETFVGLTAELLESYGLFSGTPVERYSDGMLDSLYADVSVQGRIMYLSFDVTVPANGSLDVTAALTKPASIDFIGDNVDRNGYDLVTTLGSRLVFTRQTASLSHCENVELLRDNFGFDLENGITSVVLDPAQEHYGMDVRKKPIA